MYESKRSKSYIIVFQAIVCKIKELQEWKKKSARKLEVHICVCKFLPRKLSGAKATFTQELVLSV